MKNIACGIAISLFVFSACSVKKAALGSPSSHRFEVSYDNAKVLKGTLKRSDVENDTAFAWFKQNMQYGRANIDAINAFKKNSTKFKVVVFFGTWCEDSQNLVPVFYRLVDKSGYPDANITLIGVDRAKTTLKDLQKKYNIINVPTFIIMKDGKEVGRVVEYGKYGEIDKELGEIVATL